MSTTIFIATRNEGKVKEFAQFFSEIGINVKSLLDLDDEIDVIEDGATFEENAMKKAKEIGRHFNITVMADDSGLEVDYLNGAPGIYSARYAGEQKNDQDNNEKLIRELKEATPSERTASFVCALAIYFPNTDHVEVVRGECKGIIKESPKGNAGFGYDPLFYVPEVQRTMAELTKIEKNKISHRAEAMKKLKDKWKEWK